MPVPGKASSLMKSYSSLSTWSAPASIRSVMASTPACFIDVHL